MTGRQMIKLYKRRGWIVKRIGKTSHYKLQKKGHTVSIPHHTSELKKGL